MLSVAFAPLAMLQSAAPYLKSPEPGGGSQTPEPNKKGTGTLYDEDTTHMLDLLRAKKLYESSRLEPISAKFQVLTVARRQRNRDHSS